MIQLKTKPMNHQTKALEKLLPAKVGGFFMDMGTGKTRTVIELSAVRAASGKIKRVVYFCPVTLKDTIRREIKKHAGTDQQVHVFDDKTGNKKVTQAFWHIVGIESMSSSNRVVLTVNDLIDNETMVVVDESQYIKGHDSKRTKRITILSERARYRVIMTGTPVTQGIEDLFAQLRFLSPKILGYSSFFSFANNHLEYSEKFKGMVVRAHNTNWLANRIAPYVYQVRKQDCLDLPKKTHVHLHFDLTDEQRQDYELLKTELIDAITTESTQGGTAIFRLFTQLQQIACGFFNQRAREVNGYRIPALFYPYKHRRLGLLCNALDDIADHEPVIIWTKFRHCLDEISATLQKVYGLGCVAEYHGGLSEKHRSINIQRFRQGARFFLATPSSGGHGLTLNEASYVVFYDSGFKYSEQLQAEDRCHRIGQARPVTYIHLWAECGIENLIFSALYRKGNTMKDFRQQVEKVKHLPSKEQAAILSKYF